MATTESDWTLRVAARRKARAQRGARNWSFAAGLFVIAAIILCSIIIPAVSPYGPNSLVATPLQAPSVHHLFGTDTFGRDVFTRTFAAARIDYLVAVVGVGVPLLFGSILGALAGFSRWRIVDSVVLRATDVVVAFPFVVLVLTFAVMFSGLAGLWVLPAGLPAVFLAIFIVGWAPYARLARVEAARIKDQDFIVGARLAGLSNTRILMRHVLPVVVGATATYAVADTILIIILTASLAFLGAGVPAPTAEWGAMMYEGRSVLSSAWWIMVFPGVAVCLTGLAVYAIAQGLLRRSGSS